MTVDDEDLPLASNEKQIVQEFDSRHHGFLNSPEELASKALFKKVISSLEKYLAIRVAEIEKENASENEIGSPELPSRIYCVLGHMNLLVEDYSKALSAYQKYYNLKKDYWKDSPFLYGLGIAYFYYNSFQWATKAFQHLLYTNPRFCRANEVQIRLGLMCKANEDYDSAIKHFRQALNDSNPCTWSKAEIRFNIAHVLELEKKYRSAKEVYEDLLSSPVQNAVKANSLRQLGWLYHTVPTLGELQTRETLAIQSLHKSIEADNTSGQSWYLLGRCFSKIGKVHDAFVSYRHSIDKSEASADTWCSIGVLYQQQNQPMDALQAYICAVQLDKTHVAAWTDLGILYESCNQPKDALTCFLNAAKNSKSVINSNLSSRIRLLQQQLANIPQQHLNANRGKGLPSIEEAWSLPIPAELTSRQGGNPQPGGSMMGGQQAYLQQGTSAPGGGQLAGPSGSGQHDPDHPSSAKRAKMMGKDGNESSGTSTPTVFLSPQQVKMLQYLQQNQGSLNPQQQQLLAELQHQHILQQQQLIKLQQDQGSPMQSPNKGSASSFGSPGTSRGQHSPLGASHSGSYLPSSSGQSVAGSSSDRPNVLQQVLQAVAQGQRIPEAILAKGLTEQDLAALLSRQDITASLTEDLLAQFAQAKASRDSKIPPIVKSKPSSSHGGPHAYLGIPQRGKSGAGSRDIHTHSSNDKKEGIKEIKPELSEAKPSSTSWSTIKSADILKMAKGKGKSGDFCQSMLSEDSPPPVPPEPPQPPLSKDQLNPPTPSVYLDSKKDAFSVTLQQYFLSQPVGVIRGLASALKLDLGLFSTKSLVEANPDHRVEVRTQKQQSPDENKDEWGSMKWRCESSRSHTSIAKYAQYQASSFQESLREENEKTKGVFKESDSDSNSSTSKGTKKKFKMIKFGTNVDLSDEKKWKPQLQELTKLPAFTRVVSASNMLSHVGHVILGVNSVQLYMKVPGSRTPGHQENHNFCSVNVNIGPGDCEWFSVPNDYWGAIHRLCEKNNIHYLKGSWWPMLEDLYENNIPVYRFIQKPGDLVWVGSGTVHWVQAIGWCNNIAWNVGPLIWKQYQLALERYEYNKVESYKSIVPIQHLSWNLARNIKITDPKLFELLKQTLSRTIKITCCMIEYVEGLGKEVKFHGKLETESVHYCNTCEIEVFNMLYVLEQDKRHQVHCIDCARKASPNLEKCVVLNQFRLSELCQIFDNFQLGSASTNICAVTPSMMHGRSRELVDCH